MNVKKNNNKKKCFIVESVTDYVPDFPSLVYEQVEQRWDSYLLGRFTPALGIGFEDVNGPFQPYDSIHKVLKK